MSHGVDLPHHASSYEWPMVDHWMLTYFHYLSEIEPFRYESIKRCVLDTEQRPFELDPKAPCGVVGIVPSIFSILQNALQSTVEL